MPVPAYLATLPGLLENIGPLRGTGRRLGIFRIGSLLAAGCAHAASIAWPFKFLLTPGQPVWWLEIVALAILFWQLMHCPQDDHPVRSGAVTGWLFATAMQCATWWWLYVSLHDYGGLASPLTVLAIVGLAAFLALYHAAVCGTFVFLAQAKRGYYAINFAALWLLAELARVAFFTGFPWGEGGYAQLDGPFVGLAKLVGVHGLTLLSALGAAAAAGLLRSPRLRAAIPVVALVVLAVLINRAVRTDGESASVFTDPAATGFSPFVVTLLQGNISQDEKFKAAKGIPNALAWYGEQLQNAKTPLVVTPETAIPLLPAQLPEGYADALVNRFARPPPGAPSVAALIGIPLGSSSEGYTNSVIGIKPLDEGPVQNKDEVYRYDKHHLVPFGEFVHPLFKWYLRLVNIPLSDFNRGAVSQPSFEWQGQRLAPNICYEDLFGEELAVRFQDPQLSPTIFVNISNIAWFGNTIAIDQHLNISRMRAVEFERPMIRATNTGATAIIDYRGQVTHFLPRHTRGVLFGEVQGRTGATPYAWWASRYGLWPWWILCTSVLALAFLRPRR